MVWVRRVRFRDLAFPGALTLALPLVFRRPRLDTRDARNSSELRGAGGWNIGGGSKGPELRCTDLCTTRFGGKGDTGTLRGIDGADGREGTARGLTVSWTADSDGPTGLEFTELTGEFTSVGTELGN